MNTQHTHTYPHNPKSNALLQKKTVSWVSLVTLNETRNIVSFRKPPTSPTGGTQDLESPRSDQCSCLIRRSGVKHSKAVDSTCHKGRDRGIHHSFTKTSPCRSQEHSNTLYQVFEIKHPTSKTSYMLQSYCKTDIHYPFSLFPISLISVINLFNYCSTKEQKDPKNFKGNQVALGLW